jgi:hypothetical protein
MLLMFVVAHGCHFTSFQTNFEFKFEHPIGSLKNICAFEMRFETPLDCALNTCLNKSIEWMGSRISY